MANTYFKPNQDAIFDIMQNCSGVYWKVHNGQTTNGSILYFNEPEQNHANSMATSQAKLKKFLDSLPSGAVVHISFSQKGTSEKGRGGNNNFDAKVVYENADPPRDHYAALMGVQQNTQPQQESASAKEYYALQLEAFKKEMQLQQQIADLKRELKEAKEGSPTDQLIAGIAPMLLQKFAGGQAVAQPPQYAVNGAPTPDADSELEEKFNSIIGQLYELEGEALLQQLEILLKLRQQNPTLYSQAVNMAKNSVE